MSDYLNNNENLTNKEDANDYINNLIHNNIKLDDVKIDEEALSHYGISGMRWGYRRFQNPDGTLTEEGRERYGYKLNSIKGGTQEERERELLRRLREETENDTVNLFGQSTKALNDTANIIKTKPGKYKTPDYSKLSDKEMRDFISRKALEKQYSDIRGETKYIKSGSEKTREILQTVGSAVAIAGTVAGIVYKVKKNVD